MGINKSLILIRHAHRNKILGREIDNGLSKKGHDQSAKLFKYFKKHYPSVNPLVVSSPKKRCIETILPIVSNELGRVQILPCLDEGDPLDAKLEEFLKWWHSSQAPLTLSCSHGDWIPHCILKLTGTTLELNKGGWVKLEQQGSETQIIEIIQEFH